jgi:hypothetical protein
MSRLIAIVLILAAEDVAGDNTASASATVNQDVIYAAIAVGVFIFILGTFCYLKKINVICMMEDEELHAIQGRKAQPGEDGDKDDLDKALDAKMAAKGLNLAKVGPQKVILPPIRKSKDPFDLEDGEDGPRNSVTLADIREGAKRTYLKKNGGFPMAFVNPTKYTTSDSNEAGLTCPNHDCEKAFSSMAALHRHFIIAHPETNRRRVDYTKTFTVGWCLFLRNVVILMSKVIFMLSKPCHKFYPQGYEGTCHRTEDSITSYTPKCAILWDDIDCYGVCDLPSASYDCYWLPSELPMYFALNMDLFLEVMQAVAKTVAMMIPWLVMLPFLILAHLWGRCTMAYEISILEHPDDTVFLYPLWIAFYCVFNFFFNLRMDILRLVRFMLDVLCRHITVDVYEAPVKYVDPRDRWQKKRGPCTAVYEFCCCVIPAPRLRSEFEDALSKIPQGRKRVFVEFRQVEWPRALEMEREARDAKFDEDEAIRMEKLKAKRAKYMGDAPPV